MKKLFFIFALTLVAFLARANNAFAVESTFTSCLTPPSVTIAPNSDGTHGIVGQGSKEGKDIVYKAGENDAMQCLCATDGTGIQTNWLSASGLTSDQIKIYQNQGWIFVPDGSAWGLGEGSFLAQNINYSCGGYSLVQSATGDAPHGDGLSDGRSDGLSDGKSSSPQATAGSALASTGNILFVLSILGAGIFTTLFGLWLRRNTN